MILSGHQPVYLPGIGLFNKIALSDAFMFVGHCQYSNKSWQTRNRIRLNDAELFLSVPVAKSGRFGQSINETEILNTPWKRKHLGSIQQAYAKRPFFGRYFPELKDTLERNWTSLGEMNMALIQMMMAWFDIATPVLDSKNYAIEGQKTDMLISMCKAVNADRYLSNEGSRDYVMEAEMAAAGILHNWQNFVHPVYEQGADFMPNLSAIDIAFNIGPDAAQIIKTAGVIAPGAMGLCHETPDQ